jgi:hypothetical protein
VDARGRPQALQAGAPGRRAFFLSYITERLSKISLF